MASLRRKGRPQPQCSTKLTGRVKVPLIVGLNFQFAFTQREAALASIGGPEASTSTILPFSTVIRTLTSPAICICNAVDGYGGLGLRSKRLLRGPPVPVPFGAPAWLPFTDPELPFGLGCAVPVDLLCG